MNILRNEVKVEAEVEEISLNLNLLSHTAASISAASRRQS
jgi:hypothetical protein